MSRTQLVNSLEERYGVLQDASRVAAQAEEDVLRNKARLAYAERVLDELTVRLVADAPDTCKNEVQRKAYALEQGREAAVEVEALRQAHLESEINRVWARHYYRIADDLRRFLELMVTMADLPDDALLVPALPGLPSTDVS